jgi:single-strand DNA-binding protein
MVLGNLTRDPEMRYTPNGSAVTSFSVATNRSWKTEKGDVREESEFHNVVAWNKLAELCSQLLQKGTRVFVQGRLQTRSWDDTNGTKHYKTEIVADDMVVLERARQGGTYGQAHEAQTPEAQAPISEEPKEEKKVKEKEEKPKDEFTEEVAGEEIPF